MAVESEEVGVLAQEAPPVRVRWEQLEALLFEGRQLLRPDPRRRLDVGQLELLAATCFSQTAADLDRGSPPRSSLP